MVTPALVVVALLVGYGLGERRIVSEARRKTGLALVIGRPDGKPLGWPDLVLRAVLHPAQAARAWRHRHDPPKPTIPVSTSEILVNRPKKEKP